MIVAWATGTTMSTLPGGSEQSRQATSACIRPMQAHALTGVNSPWCASGTIIGAGTSPPKPMLDSPSLRIAVRRDPPTVEDLRSTTVSDDPVQRRDLILLERAREGDLDAFNDLVVLYQDQLFALVVRMVPDRDQASDCVQEAFFSAYRNLTSFRGGSVKSWLNRICVNAAMDTQRARKRRPVQPYPEFDDESWQPPAGAEADPERTAMLAERTRALSGALAGITDDQRSAIVLYDVEGYDYAEIAEMTGVSLGTVKSRVHRGRLALRELLGDRMELFRG
jgi:RNA polymerase sigma-70 factor (ECF subfamily)